MANFVWLVALLCVQFCRGEDVLGVGKEAEVVAVPAKPGTEPDAGAIGKESAEEEWTEEDEKWLEEIQNLLGEDSDEDYDMDYTELGKLLNEIETLMKEHHPEKSDYEWLLDIAEWFTKAEEDYEDDAEGKDSEAVDDLTLSWFYPTKTENESPAVKRFSSV